MPLFRCSDCGFVTTASEDNALRAHDVGSPQCTAKLELVVDFRTTPIVRPKPRRRRKSGSVVLIDAPAASATPTAPATQAASATRAAPLAPAAPATQAAQADAPAVPHTPAA